jgi:hypothetical protein
MEFNEFYSELTSVMIRYKQVFLYYQESENRFLMPAEPEQLPEFAGLLNVELPEDFISFYSNCAGLLLANVGNSILLYPLKMIMDAINHSYIPVYMESDPPIRMVPFGWDVGGNMLAIIPDKQNGIYYFQHELFDNIDGMLMYSNDRLKPKRVADTFSEFLDAVLEDARAYLEQRPGWKYLDDGLYGS